jgi:hypothetical protein
MKKRKAAWYAAAVYHASQSSGPTYDSDMQAYITATGLSDQTYIDALNTFIIDLKAASVWTKFDRLWVLANAGATPALTCLKSLELATAVNTPTFTAGQGYAGNGTSSYLDLEFAPDPDGVNYTLDSAHVSLFSRTNAAANVFDMGIGTPAYTAIVTRFANGNALAIVNGNNVAPAFATAAVANSQGLYQASRTGAASTTHYKDGASIATSNHASTSLSTTKMFLGCISNANTPADFSSRQFALASIGAGFNDTEAAAFDVCVDTLKTAIGF